MTGLLKTTPLYTTLRGIYAKAASFDIKLSGFNKTTPLKCALEGKAANTAR